MQRRAAPAGDAPSRSSFGDEQHGPVRGGRRSGEGCPRGPVLPANRGFGLLLPRPARRREDVRRQGEARHRPALHDGARRRLRGVQEVRRHPQRHRPLRRGGGHRAASRCSCRSSRATAPSRSTRTASTGEIDPADTTRHEPLAPGAPAPRSAWGPARRTRSAAPYFLELTYSNDQETPEQMKKSSDAILTALAKDVAAQAPRRARRCPPSAKALPEAERIPNGVLYYPKDLPRRGRRAAPAPSATTASAQALPASWPRRRDDAEQAKDVIHTLRGKPARCRSRTSATTRRSSWCSAARPSTPKIEWVVARKGGNLSGRRRRGVRAQGATFPRTSRPSARLSKDEQGSPKRQGAPRSKYGAALEARRPGSSAAFSRAQRARLVDEARRHRIVVAAHHRAACGSARAW